jgi:hypothetical protein
MSNSEEWLKNFGNHKKWKLKSVALYDSAKMIQTHSPFPSTTAHPIYSLEFIGISEMLIGYAFETALKGRIIERFPEKVNIEAKMNGIGVLKEIRLDCFGQGGDGHDLNILASISGINNIDPQRKIILEWLTEAVRWRGRYPAPKVKKEPKNGKITISYVEIDSFFWEIIGSEYKGLDKYMEQVSSTQFKVERGRKHL